MLNIMSVWIESQLSAFQSLEGSPLTQWRAVEMALNEAGTEDGLIWYDKSVPMLQLLTLFALIDNQWREIATYQDDDEFGLSIKPIPKIDDEMRRWPSKSGELSIYRLRVPDELPRGRVSQLSVRQNGRGNIASVEFLIQDRVIQLLAGEVYETHENTFEVKFMDESVLVQVMVAHQSRHNNTLNRSAVLRAMGWTI